VVLVQERHREIELAVMAALEEEALGLGTIQHQVLLAVVVTHQSPHQAKETTVEMVIPMVRLMGLEVGVVRLKLAQMELQRLAGMGATALHHPFQVHP
jgi:hypothetical protein